MSVSKMIMGQAANQYVAPTYVEDVFSTYLYDGTGSAQTITNGIDLAGEGGLVWTKTRSSNQYGHRLIDEGSNVILSSDVTNGALNGSLSVPQYYLAGQSNGFNLIGSEFNVSGQEYASWTFRKQPKFFDIVTYTGNSTAGRTISHNLGSVPGMMIVKRTSSAQNWVVYHRENTAAPETDVLYLNSTDATTDLGSAWYDTVPTSTEFTLGDQIGVNANGETYVAYLFAHNDGDGGFGLTNDQDIIKCGSYTGSGQPTKEIDLGFEPQWIMVKNSTDTSYGGEDWYIFDNMRGMVTGDGDDPQLFANKADAEQASSMMEVMPTGFRVTRTTYNPNVSGTTYIYMAIRRGPMDTPTSATDVFAMDTMANQTPAFDSGFPVDMAIRRNLDFATSNAIWSRLTGQKYMNIDSTAAESNDSESFDHMDGWGDGSTYSGNQAWMWKRAPGYFDVCCYTGNGTAGSTVSHNLGVVPEMMWVKGRSNTDNWSVYHKDLSSGQFLQLNVDASVGTNSNMFTTTAPTSSVFSLGSDGAVNGSSNTYIAYLFATVAGISKVGSYTGTGSTGLNIDCGFSSGARFVMIKRTDAATYDWFIWDSVRGIVSGADKRLSLNTTNTEVTQDNIDPLSSGFTISTTINGVNQSGGTYIFYAIA